MKRAFISYSLADKDRFVVTKLSTELQKAGMIITTSQNFLLNSMDFTTKKNIDLANLFVGVITDQSNTYKRVLSEWQYAQAKSIPNILVVEDTVRVEPGFRGNLVRFNRNRIDVAIANVKNKINAPQLPTSSNDEWIAWLLGGAAVIGLLSLLSKEK